jgi:hypothetical protein
MVKYDSNTELKFHTDYPTLIRNEKSFVIWSGAASGDSISYTPDFYDPVKNIYIEIKGGLNTTHFGFKDKYFQLKWKIALNHFKTLNTRLVCLMPYNGKWLTPSQLQEAKANKRKLETQELGEIKRIWKKKSPRDEDFEKLVFLLTRLEVSWLRTKKGKSWIALRSKLKAAKHPKELIKKIWENRL